MMNSALDDFFARSLPNNLYPKVAFEIEWQSLCTFGGIDSIGHVRWRPVKRNPPAALDLFTTRVQCELPAVVVDFFGSYWATSLDCKLGRQFVTLECGSWNEEDFVRKQATYAHHVLLQRELGFAPTLPIATTDTDLFYAVDISSGRIMLEGTDHMPIDVLHNSLADFLQELECVQVQFAASDVD